jgi:[ribosomal protein S5]-alanine N-acetyltransferase
MIYRLNEAYHVRGLRESDVAGPYPSWFEDQDVCRFNSHGKLVHTEEYFRAYVRSLDSGDAVVWAVCHEQDGHIGNVSLQGLSFLNRTAEFAIILGDRRHWGRGVGKLAGLKLLEHGFTKLNLNRVYCGTAATNEGMKALAAALGMRQEGIRRSHLFLEGAWVDVVDYGVLRHEFSAAHSLTNG